LTGRERTVVPDHAGDSDNPAECRIPPWSRSGQFVDDVQNLSQLQPSPLGNVITIDDERIKNHLDRVIRGSVCAEILIRFI
jgi:hypothetical protein